MDEKKEQDLRSVQLNFIGKIIASFTHEIKNHAAIIKESAGLIGDLLKMGKSSKSESQQYFEIIGSIEEQVERTTKQCSYLNRFAHRMDMQFSQIDVNECLEDLIALLQRLANQRKITFEQDLRRDLPPLYTDPSMLQFLIFCFIEHMITRLDKNAIIAVKTDHSKESVTITITPRGNVIGADERTGICPREIHDYAIQQLHGTILQQEGETVVKLPFSAG